MKRSDAQGLRETIETAAQSLPDEIALTAVELHPHWAAGTDYTVGYKVQYGNRLWRCLQAHTSQVGWEPENVASLWEHVCESHSGSEDDPIPYGGNMALAEGLCYVEDLVVYRCIRDTGVPVYNRLADLVGIYVEVI